MTGGFDQLRSDPRLGVGYRAWIRERGGAVGEEGFGRLWDSSGAGRLTSEAGAWTV